MIKATIVRDIRDHLPVRAPEWWAALLMMELGLWLLRPPHSFALSPSYALMEQMAPETAWAAVMIGLSAVRLTALILNGTLRATRRWSPLVRGAVAGLSSMLWGIICAMTWSANSGAPITPIVGMISIGELGLCLFVGRQAGGAIVQETK